MRDVYRLISRAWPFIGPLIGILSFVNATDTPLPELLDQLGTLKIVIPPRFFTTGGLFYLLLALLSFWFSYVEIRHKRIPLAVLSTDIELTFNTPKGDKATLTRTQVIRANHHDVTGYHRTPSVEPPGKMPLDEIEFHISHCETDKQTVYKVGGNPSSWDLIHRFEPIPRNLFKLGLNRVTRTETIVQYDAYTREKEYFEISFPEHYRYGKTIVSIHFHPARPCRLDRHQCQAILIAAKGIIDLPLTPLPSKAGAGPGVRLTMKKPSPGERYRIIWTYPPIEEPRPAA